MKTIQAIIAFLALSTFRGSLLCFVLSIIFGWRGFIIWSGLLIVVSFAVMVAAANFTDNDAYLRSKGL